MTTTEHAPRLSEVTTDIEAVLGMSAPHPGHPLARLQERHQTGITAEAQFYRFHGETMQFLREAQERALTEAERCMADLTQGTTDVPSLTQERAQDCMDLVRSIESLRKRPRF